MCSETVATDLTTRARVALDSCRAIHAPDDRTRCFDLDVRPSDDGQGFALTGTVETERLLGRARSSVRTATGRTVSARTVTVLEGSENHLTTDSNGVPVLARPDEAAEQVTQALFGDDVLEYERSGEWTRVRAADGCLGWIESDQLVEATPIETNAVVAEHVARPDAGHVLPGVECKVLETTGDDALVEYRTGDAERIDADGIFRRETPATSAAVADCARSFAGVPHEPGGKTRAGLDCGGLAWVAYRSIDVTLPRAPAQQRRVGTEVGRGELRPGDLAFFRGHVAVSLGGQEYVHAYDEANEVVTNSFDPDADSYLPELDEAFTTARRIIGRGQRQSQ